MPYIKYLLYVLEHKWKVFKTAWKRGLYMHAITHDLSKFSGKEFFQYARYFYIDKDEYKQEFEKAWKNHYTKNPHHWQYWLDENGKPKEIPDKYLKQMIVDWEAMALKFGDTAQAYYLMNYKKIKMAYNSRMYLEHHLEINTTMYHNYGHTLEDLIEDAGVEYFKRSYGNMLKEKYGVDLLKILGFKTP